ncbi:uncharacterized protein B0I36DRAFT_253798 [Microdochium trichocladiopsis]|uniref:Uncharacterized protein n=1 Tax=Microdochium trichocladiopsis TaxID=1682393 RepID=A0A9P8XUD5_9PEZI|nr:uncharacterized protein B0I36DRAFT_253798 [Microdochium trichocladiopsis]KAH7018086.1 hypothetical protein B0I36DRAFT_253798 [Microdochium trichocladiopsis]
MEDIVKVTRRACHLIGAHDREECCPWSIESCRKAMRGEAVPQELECDVTRLCIISGIRHHRNYAHELRATGDALFARALNARQIMSGITPVDMSDPDHLPYCIWYPEVASESACRELAQAFPQLKYNIGRACAVAGYHQLLAELDLLPDISIAEEARDNITRNPGCKHIFDHIINQRRRWLVMDDYTRTVRKVPLLAAYGLNGDTAVRSSLERRRGLTDPSDLDAGTYNELDDDLFAIYFNLTEDFGIGERSSDEYDTYAQNRDMNELLWMPLPEDLPPGNKDVLTLMAAWYGDVDRYARLRRPHNFRLDREDSMIVRGIHHNIMFAKWWTTRPASERLNFEKSITARYIMSDDLSRVPLMPHDGPEDVFPKDLPYNIWFPQQAMMSTYQELLRRQPGMKPAVARAFIVMNRQDQLIELDYQPDAGLLEEGRNSPNPFYVLHLLEKSRLLGLHPYDLPHPIGIDSFARNLYGLLHPKSFARNQLVPFPRVDHLDWLEQPITGRYNGYEADASRVELFACAPEALRPPPCVECLDMFRLYDTASKAKEPGKPLASYLSGNMYQLHQLPRQKPDWDESFGRLVELPPGVRKQS